MAVVDMSFIYGLGVGIAVGISAAVIMIAIMQRNINEVLVSTNDRGRNKEESGRGMIIIVRIKNGASKEEAVSLNRVIFSNGIVKEALLCEPRIKEY